MPTTRIPYDEMRPKVDLIIEEMREVMELLTQFRDHDFGRVIDTKIDVGDLACKVAVVVGPQPPPPQLPCAGVILSWGEALEAGEHLLGAVVLGMRDLRRFAGPDSPSSGS